jgi:hypothetical protein
MWTSTSKLIQSNEVQKEIIQLDLDFPKSITTSRQVPHCVLKYIMTKSKVLWKLFMIHEDPATLFCSWLVLQDCCFVYYYLTQLDLFVLVVGWLQTRCPCPSTCFGKSKPTWHWQIKTAAGAARAHRVCRHRTPVIDPLNPARSAGTDGREHLERSCTPRGDLWDVERVSVQATGEGIYLAGSAAAGIALLGLIRSHFYLKNILTSP